MTSTSTVSGRLRNLDAAIRLASKDKHLHLAALTAFTYREETHIAMLYRLMNVICCVSFGDAKSGLLCPISMRTLRKRSSLAVILPPQHERLPKSINDILDVNLRLLLEESIAFAGRMRKHLGRHDNALDRFAVYDCTLTSRAAHSFD